MTSLHTRMATGTSMAALAALALTGCGGGNGSGVAANGPSSTSTAAPGAGAPSSAAPGSKPSAGTRSQSPSGRVSSTETPTAASGPTAASPGTDSGPAAGNSGGPALPPSGSYHYRLRGSASSPLGNKDIDEADTLTVDPVRHHRQHTVLRGQEGSSEQTVESRPDGLFLVDIHMSQQGFDERFHPDAPVLLYPTGAAAGRTWTWHMTSTDGEYTLTAKLRLTDASSHATVNGGRVSTVDIDSTLTVTGNDLKLTIQQQDRAARDGLIVNEHAVTDGTAYGVKYHSDTTRRLTSTPR